MTDVEDTEAYDDVDELDLDAPHPAALELLTLEHHTTLTPSPRTTLELADAPAAGPPGTPGPSATFRFVQSTPAAAWLITHNLGKRITPTLTLDDSPNEPVYTDVEFIDDNTLIVLWPTPVTGRADI